VNTGETSIEPPCKRTEERLDDAQLECRLLCSLTEYFANMENVSLPLKVLSTVAAMR